MNLTVSELNVAWETLNASAYINDGGNIFIYDKSTRKAVAEKIFNYLSSISIEIEVVKKDEQ